MATFTAQAAQSTTPTRYRETGLVITHAQYTGSATLSAGDVIQMVNVGKGGRVYDWTLSTNDLGSSATATLRLGDGLDTERYMGSAQVSDGVTRLVRGSFEAHNDHGYEYTANDTVDIVVAGLGGNAQTSAPVFKLTLGVYYDN